MLPPLLSTYKQYKRDSNYVAQWLAQTAKDCGYALPPPPPPPVASNLVASTLPPRKGKKQTSTIPAPLPQRYPVPTNAYPLLAHYIVQYQPPLAVPISLVNTIKRTIKARQQVSCHYTRNGTTSKADGHLHFIRTLESVLDILKPGPSTQSPYPDMKTPQREMVVATNAYHVLEVEQPSEETAPAPKIASKSITPAPGIVEFEAESMKNEEAAEFAALCFMEDIGHLMDYVKDLWQKYADGKVELIAASAAANYATLVVLRLQNDLAAESDWFGDALQLIQWCYTLGCASIGLETWVNCDNPASNKADANGPSYTFPECAHNTLLAVSDVLLSFGRHKPETVPIYEPAKYGLVDKSRPRHEKLAEEKIDDDRIVLKEVLPLFRYAWVTGFDVQLHMSDMLLRHLHLYLTGEESFSVALAFAAQAYVEAYHIVGDRANDAFREMQAFGQSIRASAIATINLNQQTTRDPTNPTGQTESLLWVLDNDILKDRAQLVTTLTPAENKVNLPPPTNFALLKQHPLLCGMMAFELRLSAQAVGLTYCNRWCSAIPCAHLFNAMQQEKLVHSGWPELELMIEHQTAEFIFYGGRPRTPEDYSTRYALALGTSATMFAANRRDNSFKQNVEGVRLVEERAPVSCMFRDMRTGDNDADVPDLDMLLNKLYEPAADCVTDGDNILTGVRRKHPLSGNERKRIKSQKTPFLSPRQLLQAVEAALSDEFDALSFDYMALHRQCWTLFDRMKAKLPSAADSMKNSPGKFELLDLVTGVLGEYTARVKALEQCPKALRKKQGPANEQITLFAGVVEQYLQEMKQQRTGGEQCELLGDAWGYRDGVLVNRCVTMEDCVDEDENSLNVGEPVSW